MPKLHQLLAVETSTANTAATVAKRMADAFSNKPQLFTGFTKEHSVFNDEDQHLKLATETVPVQCTVEEELAYTESALAAYWDVTYQKEVANQLAKADLIIDGTVIAKDVPAIALLTLEKRLSNLLEVYKTIPILDPAKLWTSDLTAAKPGIFSTVNVEERFQTRVEKVPLILAPATDKHPAQTALQEKTVNVGKFTVVNYSGMMTAANKARKLARTAQLLDAVKFARQAANDVSIDPTAISKSLFNYING